MKLTEYQMYDNFNVAKFGDDIEVTLRPDGKHTLECDGATLDEVLEVIEMVKSGKITVEVK